MSCHEQSGFSQFFYIVLGGAISGAIGFGIAWHSRRRDGRDRFITAISEIEAVLDTCTKIDSKTTKIHSDSVASLRPEVFRVQAYVSAGCFKGLLELWHKYEAENTTITEECRRAFQIPGAPKPEPVYARDRVLEYLRQMKQLVK